MIEADFIWENYPGIKDKFRKHQIIVWLQVYKDRMIIVREDGEIKGIALFFTLTDETLDLVKNRKIDLSNPVMVNHCLSEDGDNIHFFMVVADGFLTIMKGFRETIKNNVKSVSWFSIDMKRFFIKECD